LLKPVSTFRRPTLTKLTEHDDILAEEDDPELSLVELLAVRITLHVEILDNEAVAARESGKWNRVLIDATINLDYDPDPDFGGKRFPPTVWPAQEDVDAATARWQELGLGKWKPD